MWRRRQAVRANLPDGVAPRIALGLALGKRGRALLACVVSTSRRVGVSLSMLSPLDSPAPWSIDDVVPPLVVDKVAARRQAVRANLPDGVAPRIALGLALGKRGRALLAGVVSTSRHVGVSLSMLSPMNSLAPCTPLRELPWLCASSGACKEHVERPPVPE